MRARLLVAGIALTCVFALLVGTAFAGGWTVVKKKSVSGGYALTTAQATIHRPGKLAVRLIHGEGNVIWTCSKGFSVATWDKSYAVPGLYQLAHTSGQGSCDVTVTIDGQGKITVEILKAG